MLPAAGKRTTEVQSARSATATMKDLKDGAIDPSSNNYDTASVTLREAAERRKKSGQVGRQVGGRNGNAVNKGTPSVSDMKRVERAATAAAQTNVPMRKSMWKAMKGGLKNLVPCLPACLAGIAATIWFAGPISISAAASVFFGCMAVCIKATLAENLGFLVFELVSNCLWDVLGDAVASVCFPAHASVELEDGRHIRMTELQVGDKVRSGEDSFSEVYFFSHQLPKVMTTFVQITTHTTHKIEMSPKHFVVTSKNCNSKTEHMYAQDVEIGMCVLSKEKHGMALSRVIQKSLIRGEGLYNPFTMDGLIVVDGVQASAHSDWFLDDIAEPLGLTSVLPFIYQAVLTPARWMYHAVGSDIARAELITYQETLNSATSESNTFSCYMELAGRTAQILWQKSIGSLGL